MSAIKSATAREHLLELAGWEIECESPFEIRHRDGSFATGGGALCVVECLRQEALDEARTASPITLDQSIVPGTQSVLFSEVFAVAGNKKLWITIESDSHAFQSRASVSVFSSTDLKWNTVATLPFSRMKTPHKLFEKPSGERVKLEHFVADRDELLKQACNVLGVPSGIQ